IPERATVIRVLMMELNRIASHLVWVATTGMELGALSIMTYGFREREKILDIFEMASGLRMNHAYIRHGGEAQDTTDEAVKATRGLLRCLPKRLDEYAASLTANPIWRARTVGVAELDITGCLALGVTGPVLRSAGLPWDLRKTMPYCGYETYELDVPTREAGAGFARYEGRLDEVAG